MQETNTKEKPTVSTYDRMHFGFIRFVHETLYGVFMDPFEKLRAAGLEQGQDVLEVGPGPGYFTIPAAEIVGEKGHITALDVNLAAVEYLKRKVSKHGTRNVDVRLANACSTALTENSLDVAFLFGVIHAFPKLDELLSEMHRVLKPNGKLSIQSHRSAEQFVETITASGLFKFAREDQDVKTFYKVTK
jgi:ubiquinone/menaquinone biosynthesis C-methylase UbiE